MPRSEPNVEEITRLYRKHGSIDAVVKRTKLPRKQVSAIVATIPNRQAYQRRGLRHSASKEKLKADLRKAAEVAGEPLSGLRYQEIAPGLGLAAYNTQVGAFGSFPKALKAAKVKGNPPRGRRSTSFTIDQCRDAVAQCMREHGGRVSYETYRAWASGNSVPSGSTVRLVVPGGWSEVVALALDVL